MIQWKHVRLHVKRDAAILRPLNETGAADGKEEEGWGWGGAKSGDCIKQPLEKPPLHREAEKQVQVCRATFVLCQRIHFSLQEKTHSAITTFSTILPLSITAFRRGFLRARHTEPSTALLYCAWHILEGSHCGMWRVFSFHPSKRNS